MYSARLLPAAVVAILMLRALLSEAAPSSAPTAASAAATSKTASAPTSRTWPQWRGSAGTGVSDESAWQSTWPADGPRKLWETHVGKGFSSFAVVGNRVYTMGMPAPNKPVEAVYCLNADTGKEVWTHTYDMALAISNAPVPCTPAVVDGKVFALGNGANLLCLSADDGKVIWQIDMVKTLQAVSVTYGYSASPLVVGGKVIVPLFTGRGQPSRGGGPYPRTGAELVAFDCADGKVLWRNKDGASAWSSPVLGTVDGKSTLVTHTGTTLLGIDPADGKTLWSDTSILGRVPAVSANPVIAGDLIIVPIHGIGTWAMKVSKGKVENVWKSDKGHWYENICVWNGCVYVPSESGQLHCLDLATGKTLWSSRDPYSEGADVPIVRPMPPTSRPSPASRPAQNWAGANGGAMMIADGKVLMVNGRGSVVCAAVSAQGCKVTGVARVLEPDSIGWKYHSVPTLCGGRVYCRNTQGHVVCLDVSAK